MSDNQNTYIYALIDPRMNQVRYIGQTVNLALRIGAHISEAVNRDIGYRAKWIKELLDAGLRPEIEPIDLVSIAEATEREKFWITEFRRRGCNLTNMVYGGPDGKTIQHPKQKRPRCRVFQKSQETGAAQARPERQGYKECRVVMGSIQRPVVHTVVLNGVLADEKLTRDMARRAVHVAAGFSFPATVWDSENKYGYRVYAKSARKITEDE